MRTTTYAETKALIAAAAARRRGYDEGDEGNAPDARTERDAHADLMRRTDEKGRWAATLGQGAEGKHLPIGRVARAVAGLRGGELTQALLYAVEIAGVALVLALTVPHIIASVL